MVSGRARIGQKNSLTRVWGQTGSRPVALRGRLGSGFARSIACACYRTVAQIKRHTRVQKIQEIRISIKMVGVGVALLKAMS